MNNKIKQILTKNTYEPLCIVIQASSGTCG